MIYAHVQGGMSGDLSSMFKLYFADLAASGGLTSGLRVEADAFEKYDNGLRNVLFLGLSTFIELMCILLYAIYFPKLPRVKYCRSKAAAEGSKTVTADLAYGGVEILEQTEVIQD